MATKQKYFTKDASGAEVEIDVVTSDAAAPEQPVEQPMVIAPQEASRTFQVVVDAQDAPAPVPAPATAPEVTPEVVAPAPAPLPVAPRLSPQTLREQEAGRAVLAGRY